MLLEGVQLGRYELVKRIGGGGMGDVYLAEDPQIGQKVAIKVIKTEATLNIDMALMRDFQEEARAIARLDHPHIMPLLAYSEQEIHGDTVAYIVMPYRKEGNLIQWLRSRPQTDPLSPVELGKLIQQAASALKYAHDRNIIHRDIKPANFLVRENPDNPHQPDILLSDFGLAKLSNATSSASQNVRGTPAYMPPEQWGGTAVAASDQYSLAVMAYEMLSGRVPFQGSPLQMMNQHISATPSAPSAFNPTLPEGVNAVLLCALQKKPANRYPSAMDFADNLLNALNGLPYVAHVAADGATIAAETVANAVTAPMIEEMERPSQQITEGRAKSNMHDPNTDIPIRPAVVGPRPTKTKLLFGVLAAAIILSLIVGSFVLALSAHNIGKLGKTTAQSAVSNSGTSPTVKASVTPRPKSPTPTITTKHKGNGGNGNNNGNNGGNGDNNGSGSLPPVVGNPTATPTPVPQPTPIPPTPTPQPQLCLNANPQSLTLTGTLGQSASNEVYLTLTNCTSIGETWASTQYTADGNNWIRTTDTSYTLNAGASQNEGVQASLSGLNAGTYTGYLYYSVGSMRLATVAITLNIQQVVCLQSSATSITLNGVVPNSQSNEVYITLTNCSSAAETWVSTQYTTDGNNWIRTTDTSYTLNPGASMSEGVLASLSGLAAGNTYTGYLYYSVGSKRLLTITVTLNIAIS